VPIYDESLDTDGQFIDQQPIYGNKAKTYNTVPGQRQHKGDVTILAEPNVTAKLVDSLLTKSSTAGAGPYTHVFGLSATTEPEQLHHRRQPRQRREALLGRPGQQDSTSLGQERNAPESQPERTRQLPQP
jgi:hypothetical protein